MVERAEPAVPDGPEAAPRFDPGTALLPGRADALRLTTLRLVQRSVYWIFFLGIVLGALVSLANHGDKIEVDATSPDRLLGGVLTPFALVFFALMLRVATGVVALALAYPVARLHQADSAPPSTLKERFDIHLDRLFVTRAFRALRWTRGVRHAALDRLGPTKERVERIDRVIGIANVATGLACIAAFVVIGGTVNV